MRVLVTAASRHGSTEMIGNEIVRGLRDRGIQTDFVAPQEVMSLHGYDAVVVGSAIYAGHWMKPSTRFIDAHLSELVDRPVWTFSSGPVGIPPVPDTEALDNKRIAATVHARDHRSFTGRLDRAHLGFAERAMVTLVHAEDGDFRDWDAVQEWTKSIAETLLASKPEKAESSGLGAGRAADQ
jgi:menaquinone-dependent protoporphyrinogen oxidase